MRTQALAILVGWALAGMNCFAQDFDNEEFLKELPKRVGVLDKQTVRSYGQPGLGWGAEFRDDHGVHVSIIMYDLDQKGIPDGIQNDPVKGQMRDALQVIRIMEERGQYQDVRFISRGEPVVLGKQKIPFLEAKAEMLFATDKQDKRWPVVSTTYVTGFRGRFIKIRITVPKEATEEQRDSAARLLETTVDALPFPVA